MSKLNEIIVSQLPIQSEVKPCTAYLLDNGDGTHDRYVSDEDGNLSKLEGGIKSIQAGTNINIDNTDPKNPIISSTFTEVDTLNTVALRGNISTIPIAIKDLSKASLNYIASPSTGADPNIYYGGMNQNATGGGNTSFSAEGLKLLTTGDYNSAFGSYSLQTLTTGRGNIAVGAAMTGNAGGNITGKHNLGFGVSALNNLIAGYRNLALGNGTLSYVQNGKDNVAVGYYAGLGIVNGTNNVFIGAGAGGTVRPGVDNSYKLCIHSQSFNTSSNFWDSAIGAYSDYKNGLISGDFSLREVNINGKFSQTPSQIPNATGDSSYTKNIVAKPDGTYGWEDRTGMAWSLNGNSGTNPNTNFIGTTDSQPILFRVNNNRMLKIDDTNFIFGTLSGNSITTAQHNLLMGFWSGRTLTTGQSNIFLGASSGRDLTTGSHNVAIGAGAGLSLSTTASENTFLGHYAGVNRTTGNYNTFLGYEAGGSVGGTGDNNIAIGKSTQVTPGASNQLNIGNWIYGNNGSIGIGNTNPLGILDVQSSTKVSLPAPRMTQAQRLAITLGATQEGAIVYQTDGTKGYYLWNGTAWTTLGSNIATADLTSTATRIFTQGYSFTWDTVGKPYYLKGLADQTANLSQYGKVLRIDPTTKQVAMGDSLEVAVTIPDNMTVNAPAMNVNYTVNHVYPDPVPSLPQNLIDLKNFMATIATNQYIRVTDAQLIPQKVDTLNRVTINNGVVQFWRTSDVSDNTAPLSSVNSSIVMPHDKNWVFMVSSDKCYHVNQALGVKIGFARSPDTNGVQQGEIGVLTLHTSGYGFVGNGITSSHGNKTKQTIIYTKVGEVLNITIATSDGTVKSVNIDAQTFLGDYRFIMTCGNRADQNNAFPAYTNIKYYIAP